MLLSVELMTTSSLCQGIESRNEEQRVRCDGRTESSPDFPQEET